MSRRPRLWIKSVREENVPAIVSYTDEATVQRRNQSILRDLAEIGVSNTSDDLCESSNDGNLESNSPSTEDSETPSKAALGYSCSAYETLVVLDMSTLPNFDDISTSGDDSDMSWSAEEASTDSEESDDKKSEDEAFQKKVNSFKQFNGLPVTQKKQAN